MYKKTKGIDKFMFYRACQSNQSKICDRYPLLTVHELLGLIFEFVIFLYGILFLYGIYFINKNANKYL